jgi:ADP-heptose:LPS heptosyltransferase
VRYLVRSRLAVFVLRCIDALFRQRRAEWKSPKRILLCNLAHLGDVVRATAALPIVKEAYPEAEIGFLIGSWSKPVLQNHPLVDKIHCVDHWKLNRASTPLWKKILHYLKQRKKVIREIQGYDLAIDLYPYFPNAIHMLYKAGIPLRVGYTSGGFGPLLTHPQEWKENSLSRPHLICPSRVQKTHILMHMGTGSSLKEWPEKRWKELAMRLAGEGHELVFTGRGEAECARIQRMGVGHLVMDAEWDVFVSWIAEAKLLISVDSAAVHVAAAFEVPTVVLFCGINSMSEWRPHNPKAQVLMHPVSCAPCYRKKGCASMACIRQISVDAVFHTAKKLL